MVLYKYSFVSKISIICSTFALVQTNDAILFNSAVDLFDVVAICRRKIGRLSNFGRLIDLLLHATNRQEVDPCMPAFKKILSPGNIVARMLCHSHMFFEVTWISPNMTYC